MSYAVTLFPWDLAEVMTPESPREGAVPQRT